MPAVKETPYVDLDFLERVLSNLKHPMSITLSGGEPGLIKNISDVVSMIDNCPNVSKINILSNGKITTKIDMASIQTKLEYRRHAITLEEIGSDYNSSIDMSYVVVLDDDMLETANPEEYKQYPIEWKLLTPKTSYPTTEYMLKATDFYQHVLDIKELHPKTRKFVDYHMDTSVKAFFRSKSDAHQRLCARLPLSMFIEFPTKSIGHCSMDVCRSQKYLYSKEKFDEAMNGLLFQLEEQCTECYKYTPFYTMQMLWKWD